MDKPVKDQVVNVVTHAGIRPGTVFSPFTGDIPALAARLGMTEEECEATHGMRATVTVLYESNDGMPSPFTVRNMEYDAGGERLGTWHYRPSIE